MKHKSAAAMQQVLATIEADLASVSWSRVHTPPLEENTHDAIFYTGDSAIGRYTVCSFSLVSQGFPSGSRGYDGAFGGEIDGERLLVHLTRELAEKAFRKAEEQKP